MKEPYSEMAEKSVLGGILSGPDALKKVSPILQLGDFYLAAHQEIYRAMLEIDQAGRDVDLVSVVDYLQGKSRLANIGGGAYLSELTDCCPSVAVIESHAQIIKDKSALRQAINGAREIAKQATAPNARPETIPTRLSIDLPHNLEVHHVTATIKELNRNIEAGYPGLYPCYDLLSRTIRKLSPGHLIIVGGYTSTGKSAFLVDLVCRLYRHGMENPGVAIFSTEMSCEQYILRMLAHFTKTPTWKITERSLTPDQQQEVIRSQVFLSQRNLYVYDRLYRIEDIERTARMLKDRGLDVIAIDYLQNLWGDGSIYERMSKLAPVLQYLAKDLQVTIIALSQVSNQSVREKGSGVFGYKGAGEIAASADLGIELERDRDNKERMVFRVAKNRHGRLDESVLEYVHNFTRLHEVIEGQEGYNGG